jgi:hypothetical protein
MSSTIATFKTRHSLLQWLETNQQAPPKPPITVVCEEFTVNSPAQRFIVCNCIAYAKEFMSRPSWQDRRSHELFLENAPCKLFFDLESTSITKPEMEVVVMRLIQNVLKTFSPSPQLPKGITSTSVINGDEIIPPVLVFDGSRTGKQSRHVVFNIGFFDNVEIVGAVAKTFVDAEYETCFDMGVYRTGRCFRMPFSTGFGKETYLKLDSGKESPELFLLGLLTVHTCPGAAPMHRIDNGSSECSIMEKRPRIMPLSSSSSLFGWSWEETNVFVDKLYQWTIKTHPGIKIHERRVNNNQNIEFIVSNVVCKNKGSPHKSNKTYLHAKLPPKPPEQLAHLGFEWTLIASVYFVCTDVDCKSSNRWYGGDVSLSLFQ